MSDRLRGLPEDELGAALRSLEPEWPRTPPLAGIVGTRIRDEDRAPRPSRPRVLLPSRRRTILVLVAALLALAAAATAAKLVIDIGAATIRVLPTPSALPTRVVSATSFGDPVASVDGAAAQAGFPPQLPTSLGPPDHVWSGEAVTDRFTGAPQPWVVVAWDPTPALPAIPGLDWGAVLMEFEGDANVAAKTLYEGQAQAEPTVVDGRDAFIVTGEHVLMLSTGDTRTVRVTGTVVLWQRGDLTLRLETSLGASAARDLADSVR